jgi:hypothetical protein
MKIGQLFTASLVRTGSRNLDNFLRTKPKISAALKSDYIGKVLIVRQRGQKIFIFLHPLEIPNYTPSMPLLQIAEVPQPGFSLFAHLDLGERLVGLPE